jgi:sigma-B regulation protein RsbU (phosphoserine phosphatase)
VSTDHAHRLTEKAAHGELAGKAELLGLLASVSQEFAASPVMGETLANATQKILDYMDTEAVSIFLLDDSQQHLTCVACAGPVSIEGLTIGAAQGIVGRAVASRCVQMVRDTAADADFSGAVDDITGFRTRSILCAPLSLKARSLGALEVINKRSGDGLFGDDDKQLLQALAGMVSLAISNAQMTEALVEQERIRRELDLAREIQRSLLPADGDSGFPVCGLNYPASEVSGDFYDFFVLPDGCIAWGLGDVSGKGMNAAMLMAKTISLFRCLGKTTADMAQLLTTINNEISETASHGMFVTMVAGVLDPACGEVRFANAGHQPPLYRDADGSYHEIEAECPPLGVLPDVCYIEQSLRLNSGRLFVFTDGVTEGRTANGEMLGLPGLLALLDENADAAPAAQLARVAGLINRPGTRLFDDLTMLAVG